MKLYRDLITESLKVVGEVLPWDLQEWLAAKQPPLLLDIREPYEFEKFHIKGSLNVPRGVLEQACEYGYEETVPELVNARDKEVIVICRSGNRSILATFTMFLMGYHSVKSLKSGVKGWNDFELPLYNIQGCPIDTDDADQMLTPRLRPEQLPPKAMKIPNNIQRPCFA